MLLSILLLFFLILWSIRKFKNIINPISLFCGSYTISVTAVVFSDSLGLLRLMAVEDIQPFCTLINIAVICFCTPWLFVKPNTILSHNQFTLIDYIDIKNIVFYLSVFSLILLFIISIFVGGLPMILMWQGKIDVGTYNDLLESMPFGLLAIILNIATLFLIYIVSIMINRKYYSFTKIEIIFYTIVILLLCFWQSKRQLLLMFIFIFAIRWYFNTSVSTVKNKKKPLQTFLLLGVLYLFYLSFNIVSTIRQNTDTVNKNELLEYAMYPAMNMVKIVENFPFYGKGIVAPNYILTEILPRRFIAKGGFDFTTILFEPTSPSGYLSYWFMDYGCYGIIIACLMLSLFSIYVYKKSVKSEIDLRIYILILWCCATSSVYNHFISLNFFIMPYILLILMKYLFKREKKIL